MRNLKKILALVLALIMSLSLMATAGATDFKDDADVSDTYRQAVEVLSELGVFNGDQNEQFNPGQPIRRSEVAAIIYRIATGDVTNERNDTYTPYNQFPDVIAGDWYAGYVTYCANAGYIKGRNTGNFDPKDNVTGYEVLAMILRAVGYDKNNEFVGSGWQLNTASLATQMGVLKNITNTTSLKEAATREVVAELLFQAMLLPQVNWNAATLSYDANRETLAHENLGLEELQGVVMANKWADLENDAVLNDGLTRLDVDGKDYVLEIDTPITAVGEMRHAYVQNGTKVIGNLTEGDLENPGVSIVAEAENNGGQASKVADVARGGNIRLTADTEYFVNFGEGEYYTSEWQIRYEVQFRDAAAKANFTDNYINPDEVVDYDEERELKTEDSLRPWTDNGVAGYTKTIRAGMEITGFDMLMMQGILGSANDQSGNNSNGISGYVRRVAESTVTDWSNNNQAATTYYSWARFFDECIVNNATNYTESDNGEWLKIIDKDGDGNADYVLRTDFVMTVIEDIVRDADKNITAYRMEYKNPVTGRNVDLPVDEIVYDNDPAHGVEISEEDMIEGTVILYTYIDGVYHVASPKTANKAVAKSVDLRNEAVTFTIDGADEERGWSGIERKDASRKSDITSVDRGVSYTLYYDHFGYVRLFEESSKGFVLMTDGYYATDRRDDIYRATIYNDEAAKLEDVDIADSNRGDVDDRDINAGFINPTEDAAINADDHNTTQTGHGNASTWQRLNTFGFYNYNLSGAFLPTNTKTVYNYDTATANPYIRFQQAFNTNVAAYEETENGYKLYDVDAADTEGDQVTTNYHAYTLVNLRTAGVEDAVTGETLTATGAAPGARTLWGVTSWKDTDANGTKDAPEKVQRIHTTANTKYYWVVGSGIKAEVVTWDGFSVPDGVKWDPTKNAANVAYVVTSSVSVNDKKTAYETAEIVVFEGTYKDPAPTPLSGVIAVKGNRLDGKNNAMRAGEYQLVKPTILYTMGWNGGEDLGDYASYDVNVPGSYADDTGNSYYQDYDLLDFYTYDETPGGKTVWDKVEDHWYSYHFYAGYVVDERGTDTFNDTGYGFLSRAREVDTQAVAAGNDPLWHGDTVRYDRVNVPVYKFTTVTNDRNRVGYDFAECELTYGDMVLYLTDGNTRTGEKAMMIWNVTESIKEGNAEIIKKLVGNEYFDLDAPDAIINSGLWGDVSQEYENDIDKNPTPPQETITYHANVTAVNVTNGTLTEAELNALSKRVAIHGSNPGLILASDLAAAGYTVGAVKDAAGNPIGTVTINSANDYYTLGNVTRDQAITVEYTAVPASFSTSGGASLTAMTNGTLDFAWKVTRGDTVVSSNAAADAATATAKYGDKFEVSFNANNAYTYTVTTTNCADVAKGPEGGKYVITGTITGATSVTLAQTSATKLTAVNTAQLPANVALIYDTLKVGDTTAKLTPGDTTGATSPDNVLYGTQIDFTVTMTPAANKSFHVYYTTNGVKKDAVKGDAVTNGFKYSIPSADVGAYDITVSVEIEDNSAKTLTFTNALDIAGGATATYATTPNAAAVDQNPIDASSTTVDIAYKTGTLYITTSVPAIVTSSPAVSITAGEDNKSFTITNVTEATSITISAAPAVPEDINDTATDSGTGFEGLGPQLAPAGSVDVTPANEDGTRITVTGTIPVSAQISASDTTTVFPGYCTTGGAAALVTKMQARNPNFGANPTKVAFYAFEVYDVATSTPEQVIMCVSDQTTSGFFDIDGTHYVVTYDLTWATK